MPENFDEEYALMEAHELWNHIQTLSRSITDTERFSIAGAAAFAAFSISGLTAELDSARVMITAIPLVVLCLAALRCLTLYLVLAACLKHLQKLEEAFVEHPSLGFRRNVKASKLRLDTSIEFVSAVFWIVACGAALIFWLAINGFI